MSYFYGSDDKIR